jgi:Tol biopolymer transport system component
MRLTFEGANRSPIWTPDGRRVTFGATIAGKNGIYSAPADGSGKTELLLATEKTVEPTSWSPDGSFLVYSTSGADAAYHLWVVPVERGITPGKPQRLHDTPVEAFGGEISPDGRWLAYTSVESGSYEIYVQPFPGSGGKVRISTDDGVSPRWSKNGRELFYWDSGYAKLMSVDVQATSPFRAGIPKPLFAMQSESTFDVAPDGKRFLVEQNLHGSGGTMEVVVNWFDELRRRVPVGK